MDYTKNHRLPQWVESDRILMDDFNDAMSNIESGMTANAQAAAAAQSAANAARSAASAAGSKANAAYSPSNKPYVIGSYTGNSITNKQPQDQEIHLGFKPSFLIIAGMNPGYSTTELEDMLYHSCLVGAGTAEVLNNRILLTSTGFTVRALTTNAWYPDLNENGRHYDYIAFK